MCFPNINNDFLDSFKITSIVARPYILIKIDGQFISVLEASLSRVQVPWQEVPRALFA